MDRELTVASPFADTERLIDYAIAAGVGLTGLASAILVGRLVHDWRFGTAFLAGFACLVALVVAFARIRAKVAEPVAASPDAALLRTALDAEDQAIAVTACGGGLVAASRRYVDWFGGLAPPALPILDRAAVRALDDAGRAAWRDGAAEVADVVADRDRLDVTLQRGGLRDDHLVWRFRRRAAAGELGHVRALIEGEAGERLGRAGVMALIANGDGRVIAANRVLAQRALGRADATPEGRDLAQLIEPFGESGLRLSREGSAGNPLRLVQLPLAVQPDGGEAPKLLFLLDETAAAAAPNTAEQPEHIHALLAMLPLGLALADRDGRFVFQNDAFLRAAGRNRSEMPVYPGDLVVREDKNAVADAVRRFANADRNPARLTSGRIIAPMAGDLAIRLAARPEEPVVLTVARAQGLGQAAVLLSLKDSSEESKLKRQAEQATKMQAVGQLAGGIAHDFNNILTAVLGHCDLILLRHTPGDSDYDDIQQIRTNANRAANLTRQLLAFSRQQTLRPQILQLPDVVADVSNLLKRLMGEGLQLVTKHGRSLGPVRADPGQLEQVIVNLSLNARDAMPDGGTLTIQTYAVSAAEVRRLGSDILPAADYTALSVTDTGVGISPEVLPKIFEPFFTTKEVGKGTGLGLSTVYGIVKQSGGFIFADSTPGEGTSFVIYLPVHRAEPGIEAAAPKKEKPAETWGAGNVLLVEDEDMVRAVAERALVRQGYRVMAAANGEEALELLAAAERGEADRFDLLVSDVVMPTMDGPALVREARRRFPTLPVLFMSGYAEEQLRKSIDIDKVDFLPKPFSVQQLAEAARAALDRKGAG
ncbi:MAG: response regulator [Sphingomonadaceae bacterium]|nr:response regulator [Sphingomonadaceae bacterium]